MPTGTGAINLRNLPVTKYTINPGMFNQLTSRSFFDPINFSLPTFGNYTQNQLLQVGIVGAINLYITGTITTASSPSIAPTALWPWGLISVQITGNGQNNFINCNGWDLKIREWASARALQDDVSFYPSNSQLAPFNSAGTANFALYYKIPIAMDDTTLVGALYAQSEATNLTYRITTAAQSDLFTITTGTLTISATVYLEEEIYEVPYDPQHPDTLIIPDLTVLHGLVANDNAVASQTIVNTNLFRINGQMERLIFYTYDLSSNPGTFVSTSEYTQAQLLYGSNQTPYTFNPLEFLRYRNNRDYRRALPDGVYVLDLVSDNPARDQVLLEGVTNLRLQTQYDSAPTGGSYVHFVQETLFA